MGDTRVNSLNPIPNYLETNAPTRPKALLVTLFVCALLAFAVGICVFAHVNVLVRLGNLGGGICLGSGALLTLIVCVIYSRSGAAASNTTEAPPEVPPGLPTVPPATVVTHQQATVNSAHATSYAYQHFGTSFVEALKSAIPSTPPYTEYTAVEVIDAVSVPGNEITDPLICSPILIERAALSTYLNNGIADLANHKTEGTIKIECLLILKNSRGFFNIVHYQKEIHFKRCADGTFEHYMDGDVAPVVYRNIISLQAALTGIMERVTLIAPFTSSFIV